MWAITSRSGRTLSLIGLALLVTTCSDYATETGTQEDGLAPPAAVQSVRSALSCRANVQSATLDCERPQGAGQSFGPNFLIVGGQGEFVQLTSANPGYDSTDEIFYADVAVQNLIGQPIGTSDGLTVTGVRVFFHSGPTVTEYTGPTAPTVTVANADGVATFTATDQPYHLYDEILFPGGVSASKTWGWNVPPEATEFVFEVFVEGPVYFPTGWIEVAPHPTAVGVGSTIPLTATIKDVIGRTVTGTVNWSSSADTVAEVNAAGTVSGVAPGVADIFASAQGKPDGWSRVTVIGSGYNVELRTWNVPPTPPPAEVVAAFANAKARWESVITNDVQEIAVNYTPGIYATCPRIYEVIDDLLIFVSVDSIDGPDNIVGQAGPCLLRSGGTDPGTALAGSMTFDIADLEILADDGILEDVILHEMGHVLGIGVLWGSLLVPSNCTSGTVDPYFNGPLAVAAFDAAGGTAYTGGNKVPVEDTGGAGTVCSHWRDTVHDNELMTGWVNLGANPLSAITIQSLADMGYSVDLGAADSYTLPTPAAPAVRRGAIQLKNDVLLGPIYTVDQQGTITRLPER